MKRISLLSGLVLLLMISLIACGDMEETYREFAKDGEIIYIGKADSIKVRGGRERIEIKWLLLSDPKVTSYKITWNNNSDSTVNSVVKTQNVDTVKVLLENLSEGIYNFKIYLYDNLKNSSVSSSVTAQSYGSFYESTLLNRVYTSVKRINVSDVAVTWSNPSEEQVGLELEYVDGAGVKITKSLRKDVLVDTLKNVPPGGTLEYRTSYKPESNALDVFHSAYNNVVLN